MSLNPFKTFRTFKQFMVKHDYLQLAPGSSQKSGGELFKNCRQHFGKTQNDIATAAGIERTTISNIERNNIKNRLKSATLNSIISAFQSLYENIDDGNESKKLPLPTEHEIRDLGENLFPEPDKDAQWYIYYLTRRPEGNHLIQAEIKITHKGRCTLYYEKDSLTYEGVVFFESGSRLLILLDSMSGRIAERMVIRLDTPIREQAEYIYGSWLGIDGDKEQVHSRLILSKNDLSKKGEESIRSLIKNLDSITISDHKKPTQIQKEEFLEEWEKARVINEIKSCKEGDSIDICSTYFHGYIQLTYSIKSLYNSLRKAKTDSPLTIRIMLMNPKLSEAIALRFSLLLEKHDPVKEIIRQAEHLLILKKAYKSQLEIKVKFFDTWPLGHYFKFSTRSMYIGTFLPLGLARESPAIILKNNDSLAWAQYETNFDYMFENGTPAEEIVSKSLPSEA